MSVCMWGRGGRKEGREGELVMGGRVEEGRKGGWRAGGRPSKEDT